MGHRPSTGRAGEESPLIIERTMDPGWLSNSYLVAGENGHSAVVVDTGGPMGPLAERARSLGVTVTHVLCTHHHHDHVAHNGDWRREFGTVLCGHRDEATFFDHLDRTLADGEIVHSGSLAIRALHIPGHTAGQLAYVVNDERVFTGDTLFLGSVGGTRAPGHTTFDDIRRSIMNVLMKLPG
ncbi:MAG: MBL fold metallo-hydrolase, partial [Acidobacteriota bacterium]